MESGQWREVPIDKVTIGPRFRKDLEIVPPWRRASRTSGCCIYHCPAYALVVGRKRLAAYAHLERPTIPAFVLDLDNVLKAEFDENERRKDLNPSERVAIIEALHEHLEQGEGAPAGGAGKNTAGKNSFCKFYRSYRDAPTSPG